MGEGDGKLGVANEPSVMEDLFESIVGAVYIDCGMNIETVIGVVCAMLDVSNYFTSEPPIQSYKNALQEWCADKKRRLPAPVYQTVSESGPDHKRVYERAVIIGDRTVAVGKGKNLKIADSAAAEAALEVLKNESGTPEKNRNEAILGLKALATKNKQPSPEFRDLGESTASSATAREYVIECRFMGNSTIGVGKSKQEARICAAERMLVSLEPKKEKAQGERQRVKKSRAVPKVGASGKRIAKPSSAPKKQPHQHKKHL
jgi:dsRNA-specific ribonuclease